jgi:TolA-binding protein
MKDPKRLLAQDSDRVTRLLLEAGRAESPGRPRLTRMAVAAAAGATLSAKAAASTAVLAASPMVGGSVTSLVVLKWIGLGALGGLMLSATASQIQPKGSDGRVDAQYRGMPERETSRPAPTSAWSKPRSPEPTPREPTPTAEKAAVVSQASSPEASKAPIHRGVARQTTSSNTARISSVNDAPAVAPQPNENESLAERALREEVAALAQAKSALNQGAAAAALDAVRAYRVSYPKGRLAPEATYIEMEAALLAGDRERAEQIAERLANGTTPSARRARLILKGN